MCGRYAITLPPDAVRAYFRYVEIPNFPPRFNIAPTQPVPVVRLQHEPMGGSNRHFVLMRWGFLPGFVKDPRDFPLIINARAETSLEKASFRNAMKRRRCILMADAFYEWRREKPAPGAPKSRQPASQPFLIRRRDGAPMAFAGLWDTWTGPNGEEVDTACIVTTSANALMSAIHDRMPVILAPRHFDDWLDTDTVTAEAAAKLMQPCAEDVLEFFPISSDVNKVANDNPELQRPLGRAESAEVKPEPKLGTAKANLQGDLFG